MKTLKDLKNLTVTEMAMISLGFLLLFLNTGLAIMWAMEWSWNFFISAPAALFVAYNMRSIIKNAFEISRLRGELEEINW